MQIIIHSDNAEYPRLQLTTFGTKEIFSSLKQVTSACLLALSSLSTPTDGMCTILVDLMHILFASSVLQRM